MYDIGGATNLYRVFVHLADRRSRLVSLALAISVLFCNELCQDEKILLFPPN